MILKVIEPTEKELEAMSEAKKESYSVLNVPVVFIEVGAFKEDTKEYFDCILYDKNEQCLAQFRYFDENTVPNHTVESEVQSA